MKIAESKTRGTPLRSRLAPTPSGYLHLGNGVNFLIAWLLVQQKGGTLKLRIDDADSSRTQPEYIEDIFVELDWLGITWDEGPDGPDDFVRRHSQNLRRERYRQVLNELEARELLFPCACSRKQITARTADGLYPGTCRGQAMVAVRDQAVRIRVPAETVISAGDHSVALDRVMGDFVLWRRDDLPAYQLASLVDDLDDRMNCIVRGRDLVESTAAQLFLATALGEAGAPFRAAAFFHHPLIPGHGGQKLSKSDNALSLTVMREQGVTPALVYQATARILGLDPLPIATLADLRAAFCGQ